VSDDSTLNDVIDVGKKKKVKVAGAWLVGPQINDVPEKPRPGHFMVHQMSIDL